MKLTCLLERKEELLEYMKMRFCSARGGRGMITFLIASIDMCCQGRNFPAAR